MADNSPTFQRLETLGYYRLSLRDHTAFVLRWFQLGIMFDHELKENPTPYMGVKTKVKLFNNADANAAAEGKLAPEKVRE